jgi:hypothetical protein
MYRSACLGELQNARCAKRAATHTTRSSRELTTVRRTFHHRPHIPFSLLYSLYHVFTLKFFFIIIGQWWTHNDVITLMVPCFPLPTPILLFSVPTIILPLPLRRPVSRSCPFCDGGVLRWVSEGYFCVGSPLKLKSIGPPILQSPGYLCQCKGGLWLGVEYIVSCLIDVIQMDDKCLSGPFLHFFFTQILEDGVIDDRAMMNWGFGKLSIRMLYV